MNALTGRRSLVVLVSFVTTVAQAQEIKLVVPNDLASAEGFVSPVPSDFPNGFRVQEWYPAAQFASLPDSHHLLTGFAYRPDYLVNTPRTYTAPHTRISLSITNASLEMLSNTFGDNVGVNETVVFEGPLTLSTNATGAVRGPREFDFRFDFQTPFLYDPAMGNLLMEQTRIGPTDSFAFDSHREFGNSLIASINSSATTAVARIGGTVTQFFFVPEPAALPLGLMGMAGLLLRSRSARQVQSESRGRLALGVEIGYRGNCKID